MTVRRSVAAGAGRGGTGSVGDKLLFLCRFLGSRFFVGSMLLLDFGGV